MLKILRDTFHGHSSRQCSVLVPDCAAGVCFWLCCKAQIGFRHSCDAAVLILVSRRTTDSYGTNDVITQLQQYPTRKRCHLIATDCHHGGHLTKLRRRFVGRVTIAKRTRGVLVYDAAICLGTRNFRDSHWGTTVHTFDTNRVTRGIQHMNSDGVEAIALATFHDIIGNGIGLSEAQDGNVLKSSYF